MMVSKFSLLLLLLVSLTFSEDVIVDENGVAQRNIKFAPCDLVSRFNRVTDEYETWCIPNLEGWDDNLTNYKDEGVAGYTKGGFFPVHIGQEIGAYTVTGRIGSGSFATVWSTSDGNVLKIVRSDATNMAEDEVKVMEALRSDPPHPRVIQMLDHFVVEGPYGSHVALSFPKLGKHLATAKRDHARMVARCLLEALDYVHSKGIIHTDIKQENVLFANETAVVLVDFGGAIFKDKSVQGTNLQSREYRSPEIMIGAPFDEKIDIWSVAPIVFEVVTGEIMFKPKWELDRLEKNLHQLRLYAELLGPFPKDFVKSGLKHERFFDSDFNLIGGIPEFLPLHSVLYDDYDIDDPELESFLLSCLEIVPSKRPSAAELLKHKFLN